ncbi:MULTISPECIES: PLP-dependent aminotransferase family protein [unclassified Nonomuraea]|uniref:aminotransferase-like domain-containing protein n=1 Tax=unclassified Nonomuraea TaxID=2593643 RepID=UPI0033DED059
MSDEQLVRALGPWRRPDATLSGALASALRDAVLDGRVRPGGELPAERRLATALGVSRGTVTAALERLREGGWVGTRHGSASTMRLPASAVERIAPLSATGETGSGVDLRRAVPAAPREAYLAATRRALDRAAPTLAGHGEPGPGLPELRALIAERYTREGLATRPEQVLVTSGARAALTLLAAHLRPRVAAVEVPTYFDALTVLRGAGARLAGCRVTTGGWDLDQLEAAFTAARGGLAYLVPDFQNPTGALMPPEVRLAVAELATRHRVTVIADETMRDLDLRHPDLGVPGTCDADLRGPDLRGPGRPGAPRIRGSVLLGSASKALWGGLRIGWIRASTALVGELLGHHLCGPLTPAPMQQLTAVELLDDMEPVLDARRAELRRQRDHLSGLLAGSDRWSFAVPPGGLALWLRLTSARADTVVERARERGVELAPGPRFAADAGLTRHLRVPYTPPVHVLDEVAGVLTSAAAFTM